MLGGKETIPSKVQFVSGERDIPERESIGPSIINDILDEKLVLINNFADFGSFSGVCEHQRMVGGADQLKLLPVQRTI